jgi:hypothetical protein
VDATTIHENGDGLVLEHVFDYSRRMTVTAFTPRTGTTPVAKMLLRVHAALDEVPRRPLGPDADVLVSMDRAIARLQAVRLSLVAAADRPTSRARAG